MENNKRLTKAQKWTIGTTIGIAFVTIVLNLLIREWYSPDLRYVENSYYMLKDQAVTSCLVKNYGRKPVNRVRVSVGFLSKMLDIQISPEFAGKIVEGGAGQQNAVIELTRIVPKDQVTIFFAVERSQNESIVKHIDSREVLGKTGQPVFSNPIVLMNVFVLCSAIVSLFLIFRNSVWFKEVKQMREEARQHLEKATQLLKEIEDSKEEAMNVMSEVKNMESEARNIVSELQNREEQFFEEAEGRAEKIIEDDREIT